MEGRQEGFMVDLMEDLMSRASSVGIESTSHQFYVSPDKRYGAPVENGKWSGIVGEVIEGKADMGVAPLTINKARNAVVYFSHPFMSSVIVPLIKKPEPGTSMTFNDWADLLSKLESGNLTMGYLNNSSTETYFRLNKMPVIQSMYNISKAATENPLPTTYAEGIQRVRDGNGRYVFYGEHSGLQLAVQTAPCDVMINWGGALAERNYGFIFNRTDAGRELMEKFNQLILSAEEDGTILMLIGRWWYQKATCPTTRMCICQN